MFEYTRRTGSSSDEEIALVYDQIKGAAAENATRVKNDVLDRIENRSGWRPI